MIRRLLTLALLAGILTTTPGCAVMLGYMIADHIQRDKATETCRANLKITNEQRLREGKDLFPDQCAK